MARLSSSCSGVLQLRLQPLLYTRTSTISHSIQRSPLLGATRYSSTRAIVAASSTSLSPLLGNLRPSPNSSTPRPRMLLPGIFVTLFMFHHNFFITRAYGKWTLRLNGSGPVLHRHIHSLTSETLVRVRIWERGHALIALTLLPFTFYILHHTPTIYKATCVLNARQPMVSCLPYHAIFRSAAVTDLPRI